MKINKAKKVAGNQTGKERHHILMQQFTKRKCHIELEINMGKKFIEEGFSVKEAQGESAIIREQTWVKKIAQ